MRYKTVVIDPAWPQKGAGTLQGREGFHDSHGDSRPMPYRLMTLEEIIDLHIPAAEDAHLYLWTTNHFIQYAYWLVDFWGFTYSTTLVWAKNPMGGGLGGAYGISTEFCVFARRGNLPALSRVCGTWFNWKRPYENGAPKHSAKPPEFFAMVEAVSPGPRLEMFARAARLGWDVWGDQAPDSISLETIP